MGFSTAPYRSRSIVAPTTREVTSRSVSPEVATWAEAIKAARDSSPVRETALGSAATVWLSGEPSEAVSSVWPAACCGPVSAWTACCTGASVASEAMAQESPGINPIPASDNANAETAIFLGNMHFATSAADCGLLIARSFLESRRRHVDQRQSKELYGAERFQIHSCRPVDTSFLGQNRSKFDYRAKSYHIGQPWAPRRPIKAYDGPRQRSFLTRDYLPVSSSWFGREGTGGHYMRTQPRLLHAGP